jgi:hypothetical protein
LHGAAPSAHACVRDGRLRERRPRHRHVPQTDAGFPVDPPDDDDCRRASSDIDTGGA